MDDEVYSTVLLPASYVEPEELGFDRLPESQPNYVTQIQCDKSEFQDIYPRIYENKLCKIVNCSNFA